MVDQPKRERRIETFENAKLMFRNFTGKEGLFNEAGQRNFVIFLDHERASDLLAKGYNIKQLKPKNEGDEPQPYLPVAVRWDNFPPNINLVTEKNRTKLDEVTSTLLDYSEIINADVVINGSEWSSAVGSGIKAYLRSAFISIFTDPLEDKYADVPDSALNVIGADISYSEEEYNG